MSCIESPEVIIYKPNSYIIEILIQRVHPRPTESEFLGDKGQQLAFLMVCGPVNFFNKKKWNVGEFTSVGHLEKAKLIPCPAITMTTMIRCHSWTGWKNPAP